MVSPNRPFVLLKFACSLDGYLDDATEVRRIFSSVEDRDAVEALRAEFDAILIGAGTLREDDPRLGLADEGLRKARIAKGKSAEPLRVVLTRSGDISSTRKLFHEGTGERVIYASKSVVEKMKGLGLPADVRDGGSGDLDLVKILGDLKSLGVASLLVEGGAKVLKAFFQQKLFDRVRVGFAPELLGSRGAARIEANDAIQFPELRLSKIRNLGGMSVIDYERS